MEDDFSLLKTGQFTVLKPARDGDSIRLRFKLKSGRVVEIPVKEASCHGGENRTGTREWFKCGLCGADPAPRRGITEISK
jgi:hypothetical protein